jgi:hypothetical protein
MTPLFTTLLTARTAVVLLTAVSLETTEASAVSPAVKLACMSDYLAYCSQHSIGSPGLRQCMSAHGETLSKQCVSALVAAGEVTAAEVDRRRNAALRASAQ